MTSRKIILSIIIPAYNAEPYLSELLDRLDPQMTKDVECLIIDDGSKAAAGIIGQLSIQDIIGRA